MPPLNAKITLIKDGKVVAEGVPYNRPSEGPILIKEQGTDKKPDKWFRLGVPGELRKFDHPPTMPVTDDEGFTTYFGLNTGQGESLVIVKPGVMDKEIKTSGSRWMPPIRHEVVLTEEIRDQVLGVAKPKMEALPVKPEAKGAKKPDKHHRLHDSYEQLKHRIEELLHRHGHKRQRKRGHHE